MCNHGVLVAELDICCGNLSYAYPKLFIGLFMDCRAVYSRKYSSLWKEEEFSLIIKVTGFCTVKLF